ncbi:hypothetical protein [Sanguibacter suaedae]|uniref:Cell division protein FtsL n=1 Tax=Sanguibacter suaedae TaxID=2795737 RepID=A0A934I757_9MICO|nr:hypothetical protein [Sanguibacter suaedae]MBI9115471.1 hypothetical protein [Sanguibacter suaedae]
MSSAQSSAARVLPVPGGTLPAGRPTTAPPRLRLVQAPEQARSRAPFVLLCMAILGAALLGTLVLNTAMADGSYEAASLQRELAQQAEVSDNLKAQLDERTSPQALAGRAQELGMVQFANPGILSLSDQTIHGGAGGAGAAG